MAINNSAAEAFMASDLFQQQAFQNPQQDADSYLWNQAPQRSSLSTLDTNTLFNNSLAQGLKNTLATKLNSVKVPSLATMPTIDQAVQSGLESAASKLKPLPKPGIFSGALDKTIGKTGISIGAAAGMGLDLINSFLPQRSEYNGTYGGVTQGMDTAYDTVANAVGMIPGIGTAASLIMKAGSGLGKVVGKLGGGTDGMTKTDSILGSSFLNLTPIGLINGFGGKRANSLTKNNQVWQDQGASYGGSMYNFDQAMQKQGKKYGLFSSGARRNANSQINESKDQQSKISDINDVAKTRFLAQSAMSDMNNNAYAFKLLGGYQDMAVGKKGMKIFSKEQIEHAHKVISYTPDMEYTEVEWIDAFKEGGKIQQNVIPEGALHARLNHMDTENITKKGIPVVTQKDGGEIEQQAEIECNEIILNLDTTKKLEELMSKGDDEAAIEAGKLLAREIMENTDDRTGLIKKVS